MRILKNLCVVLCFTLLCIQDCHATSLSDKSLRTEKSNVVGTIKIASFNIKDFGKKKAAKPKVMQVLAETIRQFDIVAIQEIQDKCGTAFNKLVNALGMNYDYIISDRVGRSSHSQEQYAYIYRTHTITPGEFRCTFNDTEGLFCRDPFIARFQAKDGNFDFMLITVHTPPKKPEASQEINALPKVVQAVKRCFPNEGDFIILGDLNADCAYFDENDITIPFPRDEFTVLIKNHMVTNLGKKPCTYDRIIITNQANEDCTRQSEVFRFDTEFSLNKTQAKDVSDHYPVWSSFYINKDTD